MLWLNELHNLQLCWLVGGHLLSDISLQNRASPLLVHYLRSPRTCRVLMVLINTKILYKSRVFQRWYWNLLQLCQRTIVECFCRVRERGRKMVKQYRGQSYTKLHNNATRTRQLFTDPLFPPTGESLGHTTNQEIVWKRPSVRSWEPLKEGHTMGASNFPLVLCRYTPNWSKLFVERVPLNKLTEVEPNRCPTYRGTLYKQRSFVKKFP